MRTSSFPQILLNACKNSLQGMCLHSISHHEQPVGPDLEVFQKLQQRIPGFRIHDGSRLVPLQRSVKSPAELAMIQRSAEITAQGFAAILDAYRSGHLHLNANNCAVMTRDDMGYWGLDELTVEPCCAVKFYPEIEVCMKEITMEETEKQREIERESLEDFGDSFVGRYRKILWNLFEYPSTSTAAKVGTKVVI